MNQPKKKIRFRAHCTRKNDRSACRAAETGNTKKRIGDRWMRRTKNSAAITWFPNGSRINLPSNMTSRFFWLAGSTDRMNPGSFPRNTLSRFRWIRFSFRRATRKTTLMIFRRKANGVGRTDTSLTFVSTINGKREFRVTLHRFISPMQ